MASYDLAFEWLMDNEDERRQYAIVPDDPPGAHAISGINSASFPTDFEAIAAIAQSQRGPSIKRFYQLHFWNIWLDQISSDEVAKRVNDAGVNMGGETAVKLLQIALENAAGISLGVDGVWGPRTLQAVNNCQPDLLSAAFRAARVAHYREIVLKNPAKVKFLKNWEARAGK